MRQKLPNVKRKKQVQAQRCCADRRWHYLGWEGEKFFGGRPIEGREVGYEKGSNAYTSYKVYRYKFK